MGIKDLLQSLRDITDDVHIREYAGMVVGIDGYTWVHRGVYACAEQLATGLHSEAWITFCERRLQLLLHHNVKPYFVFDGANLPAKQATERERQARRAEALTLAKDAVSRKDADTARRYFSQAVDVTPALVAQWLVRLRARGVPFVVAPYEADAQLAFLYLNRHVEAVLTEDSDLITFGVGRVLYKMDAAGAGKEVQRANLGRCEALSFTGWTDDMVLHMCIMAGCDYVDSLRDMALKRAHAFVKKAGAVSVDTLLRKLKAEKEGVSTEYLQAFKTARLTFLHQTVFDPVSRTLVNLRPLPGVLAEAMEADPKCLDFLGPRLPPDLACAIADGQVDPTTRKAYVVAPPQSVQRAPSSAAFFSTTTGSSSRSTLATTALAGGTSGGGGGGGAGPVRPAAVDAAWGSSSAVLRPPPPPRAPQLAGAPASSKSKIGTPLPMHPSFLNLLRPGTGGGAKPSATASARLPAKPSDSASASNPGSSSASSAVGPGRRFGLAALPVVEEKENAPIVSRHFAAPAGRGRAGQGGAATALPWAKQRPVPVRSPVLLARPPSSEPSPARALRSSTSSSRPPAGHVDYLVEGGAGGADMQVLVLGERGDAPSAYEPQTDVAGRDVLLAARGKGASTSSPGRFIADAALAAYGYGGGEGGAQQSGSPPRGLGGPRRKSALGSKGKLPASTAAGSAVHVPSMDTRRAEGFSSGIVGTGLVALGRGRRGHRSPAAPAAVVVREDEEGEGQGEAPAAALDSLASFAYGSSTGTGLSKTIVSAGPVDWEALEARRPALPAAAPVQVAVAPSATPNGGGRGGGGGPTRTAASKGRPSSRIPGTVGPVRGSAASAPLLTVVQARAPLGVAHAETVHASGARKKRTASAQSPAPPLGARSANRPHSGSSAKRGKYGAEAPSPAAPVLNMLDTTAFGSSMRRHGRGRLASVVEGEGGEEGSGGVGPPHSSVSLRFDAGGAAEDGGEEGGAGEMEVDGDEGGGDGGVKGGVLNFGGGRRAFDLSAFAYRGGEGQHAAAPPSPSRGRGRGHRAVTAMGILNFGAAL